MADSNEARRLWALMIALERTKPGAQEDKVAFNATKEKQMAELRRAYERATGMPINQATQAATRQKNIEDAILGRKKDGPQTRDTL